MAYPLNKVFRVFGVLCIFFPHLALAKIFRRCELAQELRYVHGISMSELPTWICIAQHESQFDTTARNPGSGDHGIFQINEIYWCSATGEGLYACGLPCSSFQNDDIADDVECAKKIFKEHLKISGDGFNAWTAYNNFCKNSTRLPLYIADCFDEENLVQYGPEEVKAFGGFEKRLFKQIPSKVERPVLDFLKVASYAHQKLMFDPPVTDITSTQSPTVTFVEPFQKNVKYGRPRGYSSYEVFGTRTQNAYYTNQPRKFAATFTPVYKGRSTINSSPSSSLPRNNFGQTSANIYGRHNPFLSNIEENGGFSDFNVAESRSNIAPIEQQIPTDLKSSRHHYHNNNFQRPNRIKNKYTSKFTPSQPPAPVYPSPPPQVPAYPQWYPVPVYPPWYPPPPGFTPAYPYPPPIYPPPSEPLSTSNPTQPSTTRTTTTTTTARPTTTTTTTERPTTTTMSTTLETTQSPITTRRTTTQTPRPSSTTTPRPPPPATNPPHFTSPPINELTTANSVPLKHKPVRTKRPHGHGHLNYHHNKYQPQAKELVLPPPSSHISVSNSDLVTKFKKPREKSFAIQPGVLKTVWGDLSSRSTSADQYL